MAGRHPYTLNPHCVHCFSCWECGPPAGGSVKLKFQNLSREKTGRGGGGGSMAQVREGWPRRPAPAPLPPPEEGVSWGSTPAQRPLYPRPAPPRASPRFPASPRIVPRAPLRRHGGRGADRLILRFWGRGGSRCKFRQVMIRTMLRKLSYPRRSLRGGHLPVFSRRSALPPDPSLTPLPAPRQVEIPLNAAPTNHQQAVVAPPHTC